MFCQAAFSTHGLWKLERNLKVSKQLSVMLHAQGPHNYFENGVGEGGWGRRENAFFVTSQGPRSYFESGGLICDSKLGGGGLSPRARRGPCMLREMCTPRKSAIYILPKVLCE